MVPREAAGLVGRGPGSRRSWQRLRRLVERGLFYALVGAILCYALLPFLWAIHTSLMPLRLLSRTPVTYLTTEITWEHYRYILFETIFLTALRNSVLVVGLTVPLAMVVGILTAYALGRFRFRGRGLMRYSVLVMTAFPHISIITGLFLIIVDPCTLVGSRCPEFSLFNNPFALVISYLTFTVPLVVWVLANFFKEMPAELEQAASIDGATPFQTFSMILLPLAAPGLITTALLTFIAVWNEFLYALMFVNDINARTVPVAIGLFTIGGGTTEAMPFGQIMAASVFVTLPIILLAIFFERRIIEGITSGSVKG